MPLLALSRPEPSRPLVDSNREALVHLRGTSLGERYQALVGARPAVQPDARPRHEAPAPRAP